MKRDESVEWMNLAMATMSLGIEAAGVVGLRTIRAARGGPSAADEAWRMVSEKMASLAQLQAQLLPGFATTTPLEASRITVKHYRTKVEANRRRLSR